MLFMLQFYYTNEQFSIIVSTLFMMISTSLLDSMYKTTKQVFLLLQFSSFSLVSRIPVIIEH